MASETAQAEPMRFHGKPVSTTPRAHSSPVQAMASTSTRPAPAAPLRRTSQAATPGNRASPPPTPKTARGIIQA